MIDITKLIELYISRKNKFVKSEERANRRNEYFNEINQIEAQASMSLEEKKARKNSAAQKLTGNGLTSHELVDYYYRKQDFINFEIIAPIVGLWDQVLIKIYDEDGTLIELQLNKRKYAKELVLAIVSLIFFAFIFLLLLAIGKGFIEYFAGNFFINKSVMGISYLVFISPVLGMFLFILYLLLNLTDLKRLVK